jgi:gliding motility-associated-like protein
MEAIVANNSRTFGMRCFIAFLVLAFAGTARAQCSVDVVRDSLYGCAGDSVTLEAIGSGPFAWSPSASVSCDTCATTRARIGSAATAITVSTQMGATVPAVNGNFSLGNTGFTSQYTNNQFSIWNEGTYAVGPNPNAVHANFGTWGDHTTGTGNYMIVNGSVLPNRTIWQQTVTFPGGAQVTMSYWVLSLALPPGSLRVMVNGAQAGTAQAAPSSIGTWSLRTQTFTAPANGVCIIALQAVTTAGSGNDFGLDDISFSYACTASKPVWLVPNPKPNALAWVNRTSGCEPLCVTWHDVSNVPGGSVTARLWDFGDGTTDTAKDPEHCYAVPGTYQATLTVWSDSGCVATVTTLPAVTAHPQPVVDAFWSVPGGTWSRDTNLLLPYDNATLALTVGLDSSISPWTLTPGASMWVDWGDGPREVRGFGGSGPPQLAFSHTFAPQIRYEICVGLQTSQGCADTLCFTVLGSPGMELPNVFSPNADGRNDQWAPKYTAVDWAEWEVRNRNGALMATGTRPEDFWDGTYHGRPAADGVYFVIAKAKNVNVVDPVVLTTALHLVR